MADIRTRKRPPSRRRAEENAGPEAEIVADSAVPAASAAQAPAAPPAPIVPQTDEELEAETQQRYEQAKKSDLTIRDLQRMEVDAPPEDG